MFPPVQKVLPEKLSERKEIEKEKMLTCWRSWLQNVCSCWPWPAGELLGWLTWIVVGSPNLLIMLFPELIEFAMGRWFLLGRQRRSATRQSPEQHSLDARHWKDIFSTLLKVRIKVSLRSVRFLYNHCLHLQNDCLMWQLVLLSWLNRHTGCRSKIYCSSLCLQYTNKYKFISLEERSTNRSMNSSHINVFLMRQHRRVWKI